MFSHNVRTNCIEVESQTSKPHITLQVKSIRIPLRTEDCVNLDIINFFPSRESLISKLGFFILSFFWLKWNEIKIDKAHTA